MVRRCGHGLGWSPSARWPACSPAVRGLARMRSIRWRRRLSPCRAARLPTAGRFHAGTPATGRMCRPRWPSAACRPGVHELAKLVEDLQAPHGTFVHWVAWDMRRPGRYSARTRPPPTPGPTTPAVPDTGPVSTARPRRTGMSSWCSPYPARRRSCRVYTPSRRCRQQLHVEHTGQAGVLVLQLPMIRSPRRTHRTR